MSDAPVAHQPDELAAVEPVLPAKGALVRLQLGWVLESPLTVDDLWYSLSDGLNTLYDEDQINGAEVSRLDWLSNGSVEEELFGSCVTGWSVAAVEKRRELGLASGAIVSLRLDLHTTHYPSTPASSEEWDTETIINDWAVFQPENAAEVLAFEAAFVATLNGECRECAVSERQWAQFVGPLAGQEQLDWGLCDLHYQRACRQLLEVWGESLAREIDPLHDLRQVAYDITHNTWSSSWHSSSRPLIWREIQSSQSADWLRSFVVNEQRQINQSLEYWRMMQ
ncbi:MAG: hypothetical protein IPO08_23855 [Xanthomonadales bacterium]|nr:hypothetical protein [Xanthomonadales bacterium]